MFTLVGRDVFWMLPVAIITARELVISVYRSVIGTKGVSMPASRTAKYKTLAQQLAVGFAILPLTALGRHLAVESVPVGGRRPRPLQRRAVLLADARGARPAAVLPSDVSVV